MTLDNRTLYAALMMVSAVMAAALVAFWRRFPEVAGARTIGAAMSSVSVGALLIALRDLAPDFLSIVVSDLLLLGGIILACRAFRARCGLTHRPRFEIAVLGLQTVAVLYLYWATPSVLARVVAFSSVTAVVLAVAAVDLLRAARRGAGTGALGIGITYGLLALFMAVRAVVSPQQGEIESFVTTDHWLQILPTILGIVLAIGIGHAFMTMAFAETDGALRRANESLRRSNVELDRFATVVSHDLKAPLSNVIGFLDLLRTTLTRSGDVRGLEYATEAGRCALHMNKLIGELLAYARLREDAVDPMAPTDLGEVCREALFGLAKQIDETKAAIEISPLPAVPGDHAQLVRLFRNLLDNAIKYRSPARPLRIVVSASREGAAWRVSVTDNGLGVPADERTTIFEPFRRAGNASGIEGTGFGLSISRTIVERHGGRIWCESDPEAGSTFAFTVPAWK